MINLGVPVLILGESGSGKSTSLRNFENGEIGIFNVASKQLPFRSKLQKIDGANYQVITAGITKKALNCYVIDDSQYLMCFEMFGKAKETGYGKFTDMALHFYNLIQTVISQTTEDTIVYFLHHIQKSEFGVKAKTIGKMLDDQLTVEGLFSIVLMAENENGKYFFRTQNSGNDTVKSPIGMLDPKIDNDLKFVDDKIREYWELDPRRTIKTKENEREEK